MTTTKANEYVGQVRTQATNLLITLSKLRDLRKEWDACDLGNAITNDMIGGENDGITIAEITAVIGTSYEAFEALLTTHATNLYTIKL